MEDIRKTFDAWAERGEAERMEEQHQDAFRQVLETLDVRPGERILDLGCGGGWATRALARTAPGVQAIGVDASPGMIARAEAQHSYTIRARYEPMAFEALEFPDAHFDRAFSIEALYYSPDVDRALRELHRVLKPGAPVDVVIDFYADRPATEPWARWIGLPLVRRSEAEWKAAFEAAGFDAVETRRAVDRRGPGDEASFQPTRAFPTWRDKLDDHAHGSLWIRARKPS